MTSTIGFFVLLTAGINAAWILIWYLMALGGIGGAKLSKKVGTENISTNQNIEKGKEFSKTLLSKLIWRLAIMLVGYLMYVFA